MCKCCLQQQRRGQYCMLFIYIWFIIKHIFFSTTWKKKRRYCRVIPGFCLTTQSKEIAAKALEAIQVPRWLSSDILCTRERKKKVILSFYFYFALILFDAVSTGQDMLSWMAISLHHMCLSQDSRGRWILAGRELNTSTKKRKNLFT